MRSITVCVRMQKKILETFPSWLKRISSTAFAPKLEVSKNIAYDHRRPEFSYNSVWKRARGLDNNTTTAIQPPFQPIAFNPLHCMASKSRPLQQAASSTKLRQAWVLGIDISTALIGSCGKRNALFKNTGYAIAKSLVTSLSLCRGRTEVGLRPGHETSWPPMFEPKLSRKQMSCVEDSTCDLSASPQCWMISPLGEFFLLAPLVTPLSLMASHHSLYGITTLLITI